MKKHNKGFSLVELIVVVLIMAIIAVVLAPQVSSWVKSSRISADKQTMDSAMSFSQMALTNAKAYDESCDAPITITVDNDGLEIAQGGAILDADGFVSKFADYAGLDSITSSDGGKTYKSDKIKTKNDGSSFVIEIDNGQVALSDATGFEDDNLGTEDDGTENGTTGETGGTTPRINLSKSTLSIKVGGDYQLKATPKNMTETTVSWKSADESIATVDATGKVRGVAVGSTTVTAYIGTVKADCTVIVSSESAPAPTKITFTFTHKYEGKIYNETVKVEEGQTATSTWTPASDESGETWTTSDPKSITNVSSTNKSATINWTKDDSGKQITVTFTHYYKNKIHTETITVNKGSDATSTWTPADATGDEKVTLNAGEVWATTSSKVISNVSENKTVTINWTVDDSAKQIKVTFTHYYGTKTHTEEVTVTKGSTATSTWKPEDATGADKVTIETGAYWETSNETELKNVSDINKSATIEWEVNKSNVEYTITFVHKLAGKNDKQEKVTVKYGQTATSSWSNDNAGDSSHWNQTGTWTHEGVLSVSNVTASLPMDVVWTINTTKSITVTHKIYTDFEHNNKKKEVSETVTLTNGSGTATMPYDNLSYCKGEPNNLNVSESRTSIRWYISKKLSEKSNYRDGYDYVYSGNRVYNNAYGYYDNYYHYHVDGLSDYYPSDKTIAYIISGSGNVRTLTEYRYSSYRYNWSPTGNVLTIFVE